MSAPPTSSFPEPGVSALFTPRRSARRALWLKYGVVPLTICSACVLTQILQIVAPHRSLSLVFFFAAVAISAGMGGLYPGVLATLLSALACDYFFLLPLHSLAVAEGDVPLLILFVVGSLLINGLSERLSAGTRAADRRFHDLVQGIDGLVWEANPKTLQFTFVSQRAEPLLGYSVSRWLNEAGLRAAIIHPEDKAALNLYQIALAGGGDHACEYRVFAADGREVWLRETVHAACGEHGTVTRLTGLCVDITARRRADEEKTRLYEQVRAGRERLQALSRQLVQVQEAERREIARELHDEIGQALTGLKLSLEMGTRLPAEASRNELQEALALVNDLMARARELSLNLRPAMLDDLGLLPTLLWHFERYFHQTRIQVAFEHAGVERRFPYEIETTAYRIIQEALTNVARHANVPSVTVRLWATDALLGLQIRDAGRGFCPDKAAAGFRTGGLDGMTERATLVGGHLVIEAAPDQGVCLTAELPLNMEAGRERESAGNSLMSISIVLADDHPVVRRGVRALLEAEPDFRVIGETDEGRQAVELTERLQPNVLVVDVQLPGLNGMEVARQVSLRVRQTHILILSMHATEAYVLQALRNGAAGYVLKSDSAETLVDAVRQVAEGRRYLCASLSERAIEVYAQRAEATLDIYDTLTNREREILQLTAEGGSSVHIAEQLSISPRTVEAHRAKIMLKLGLRSQTDLIRYALRRGILPLEN